MTAPLHRYVELVKPRILGMSLLMTMLGYYLANAGTLPFSIFILFFCGAGLAYGGGAILNHYLERETDKLMERTRERPLPRGDIAPEQALRLGVLMVLGGVALVILSANLISAFLVLLTVFLYVLVYTPLKTVTWWNTTIGAIPGALPPVIGWTAATGQIDRGAWVLFLMLFIWQHPHFYAIAWLHQGDYKRGGMQMLPVVDPGGSRTVAWTLFYLFFLLPVSLLPTLIGISGPHYFFGALIGGLVFLAYGFLFSQQRNEQTARRLFRVSVIYLPLLVGLIVWDAPAGF